MATQERTNLFIMEDLTEIEMHLKKMRPILAKSKDTKRSEDFNALVEHFVKAYDMAATPITEELGRQACQAELYLIWCTSRAWHIGKKADIKAAAIDGIVAKYSNLPDFDQVIKKATKPISRTRERIQPPVLDEAVAKAMKKIKKLGHRALLLDMAATKKKRKGAGAFKKRILVTETQTFIALHKLSQELLKVLEKEFITFRADAACTGKMKKDSKQWAKAQESRASTMTTAYHSIQVPTENKQWFFRDKVVKFNKGYTALAGEQATPGYKAFKGFLKGHGEDKYIDMYNATIKALKKAGDTSDKHQFGENLAIFCVTYAKDEVPGIYSKYTNYAKDLKAQATKEDFFLV